MSLYQLYSYIVAAVCHMTPPPPPPHVPPQKSWVHDTPGKTCKFFLLFLLYTQYCAKVLGH